MIFGVELYMNELNSKIKPVENWIDLLFDKLEAQLDKREFQLSFKIGFILCIFMGILAVIGFFD